MNTAQLNTLVIKRDVNNRLHKGMRCYEEGLVLDVKSLVDKEYGSLDIYGKVMSQSDISIYNTNLSFDIKNNELIYTECNCNDFESNCDFNSTYICKHIGATFYKFEEAVEEKRKIKENNYNIEVNNEKEVDYSEVVLKEIDNIISHKKEKVNLQINLTKKNLNKYEYFYELDLKVGLKKYYVVKNIAELSNARRNNRTVYYGKEFKYDHANIKFNNITVLNIRNKNFMEITLINIKGNKLYLEGKIRNAFPREDYEIYVKDWRKRH